MHAHDMLRYGLWAAAAITARANRRQYGMPTAWLPHLALNTAALLLPDLLRAARAPAWLGEVALRPGYVWHVAPFTLGYVTSHPRLDIYKGPLGELRLAGFGLDAIPHALTALAFTLLAGDALAAGDAADLPEPLGAWLRAAAARREATSAALLALLTLAWETGEWLALRYELEHASDPARVNMRWSLPDTLRDTAANALGWAAARAYLLATEAAERTEQQTRPL